MREILLCILTLGTVSCVSVGGTVATPTALENQLLGVYQELDDDLVYASSVRGSDSSESVRLNNLRANAMRARSLQLFNEDELTELKDAGCVAETSRATIVEHACELEVSQDDSFVKRRQRLLKDENVARKSILEWAAFLLAQKRGRQVIDSDELTKMRRTYSRLLREAAKPTHLFENNRGTFVGAGE